MAVFRRRQLPFLTGIALLLLTSTRLLLIDSFHLGDSFEREEKKMRMSGMGRRLNGLGSSPPCCRSKCGRCAPCKAVHVAFQPGLTTPLDYYPEAWRCKCRNKLFMP